MDTYRPTCDHLVMLKYAGFCLRLGCDMLSKVIQRLVAVSPGSDLINREVTPSKHGINTIITPGQVTRIGKQGD